MIFRYYVGLDGQTRTVFRLSRFCVPTQTSHGSLYQAVIGPFRTNRAAEFMAKAGWNNPHCQTVADAERLSRTVPPVQGH